MPDGRDPPWALGWRGYGDFAGEDADWDAIRVARAFRLRIELLSNETYILEAGFDRLGGVDHKKAVMWGRKSPLAETQNRVAQRVCDGWDRGRGRGRHTYCSRRPRCWHALPGNLVTRRLPISALIGQRGDDRWQRTHHLGWITALAAGHFLEEMVRFLKTRPQQRCTLKSTGSQPLVSTEPPVSTRLP